MDKSVSHVTRLVSAQFHHTFDISLALVLAAVVVAAQALALVAAQALALALVAAQALALALVAAQALEP